MSVSVWGRHRSRGTGPGAASFARGPLGAGALALVMALLTGGKAEGAERARVTFGVIADVQYADKDDLGGRHYREALGLLERAVADLSDRDLSFVVQLGDLTDGGEGNLDRALAAFNRLRAPRYHVLGNHDFTDIPRESAMRKLGLVQAYYSFAHDGWRFVVLDTQDVSVDGGWPPNSEQYQQAEAWLARLKAEGKPNAEPWNGGVGEAQRIWLERQLADASGKGERVLVFGHIPLLAEASGDWCLLYNHQEIRRVLEQSGCVAAYLAGHDHGGGYAQRNGVHHVTFQGMVEAGQRNAYGVVTLLPDAIEIEGLGEQLSFTLPLARCERKPAA